MPYDEDAQLEADYADYLEMQAREDWEHDIEDEAYNYYILPELSEALEEESRYRAIWSSPEDEEDDPLDF